MNTKRTPGRKPEVFPKERLSKMWKEYDANLLPVEEIRKKYGLSKYMFYRLLKERELEHKEG